MSNIAALLKQYSQESVEAGEEGDVQDNQVGAEEILVVTDETTTELEEAIEEIADAVNGKEESEEALDKVIEATESLESAIESIRTARLRGQRVNGVAMQIWTKGVVDSMEARHIPAEIFQGLQEEFGDSFEADSYADYSVEAEAKGEGIMTKLWNMIKAAFARMRDWFTKFLAWFGKSAEAVEKAGLKLEKAAKDKSSSAKAGKKTIPGKGYGELVVSNQVNPMVALQSMTKLIMKSFVASNGLNTTLLEGANRIERHDTTADLISDTRKILNGLAADQKHAFANGTIVHSEVAVDDDSGSVKYKISVDSSKTKAFSADAKIMTIAEIETLGKTIKDFAIEVRNAINSTKRNIGKINVGINKELEGDALKNARKAARTITGASKIAQNLVSDAAKLTLPVAKKAYSFGMVCLNQYK